MIECNTKICFQNVAGHLGLLPKEHKKWRSSLQEYRSEYDFLRSPDLKESVAMLRMNFDYQLSLYHWLKPFLLFEEHHKYILYQIIASIYEALLLDYLRSKRTTISDDVILKIISGYLEEKNKGLGSYVSLLSNSQDKLITDDWKKYLVSICELRNTVHPSKLKSPSLPKNTALKLGLENAQLNLSNFTKNLKKRYPKLQGV